MPQNGYQDGLKSQSVLNMFRKSQTLEEKNSDKNKNTEEERNA